MAHLMGIFMIILSIIAAKPNYRMIIAGDIITDSDKIVTLTSIKGCMIDILG